MINSILDHAARAWWAEGYDNQPFYLIFNFLFLASH